MNSISISPRGFCPGVRVHKGKTIVLSLFRSYLLAVVSCLVLCSGSSEPVHEDRTTACECQITGKSCSNSKNNFLNERQLNEAKCYRNFVLG